MLTALEEGVKGGVWYSLIDKVWLPRNLWSAWSETAANKGSPGVDGTSIADMDHLMARKGYEMVRYADDFVILCQTREEARKALAEVQQWTAQAGLTLHPEKTRCIH